MLKRSDLPLATYDLAVYLPGGAVILALLAQLPPQFGYRELKPILDFNLAHSAAVNATIEAIFWLGICYLVGHLASFISTYVIEKPFQTWLGYPSEIWSEREEFANSANPNQEFAAKFRGRFSSYEWNVSSFVGFLAQIPVMPAILVFKFLKPVGFYLPKLPIGQRQKIESKIAKILSDIEIGPTTRWEKIVEHYVANNCPNGFPRMYNYLVIYGALRLIAFILLGLMWWFSLHNLAEFIFIPTRVSWIEVAIYMAGSVLYILSVCAFAKFNRRYFEESLYAFLLTGK